MGGVPGCFHQAQEVAAAIGRRRQLSPLEVQLAGNDDLRPMPMKMRVDASAPAPPAMYMSGVVI
jgi:hypothetical protein